MNDLSGRGQMRRRQRPDDCGTYTRDEWGGGELKEENLKLKFAVLDLLDGQPSWLEIQASTGLSGIRCRELAALWNEVEIEVGEQWRDQSNG